MNTENVSRDLARAVPVAPGDLSRLHGRLASATTSSGIWLFSMIAKTSILAGVVNPSRS